MRLGAVLAGRHRRRGSGLGAFGRAVGLAFQIVDDVLDLTASEEVLGKPVASDLREGKATLAVIHSADHGTAADRKAIRRVLDDRSFENVSRQQIREMLVRNGSVEYAMSAADRYAEQSRQALAPLADTEFKRASSGYPILSWRGRSRWRAAKSENRPGPLSTATSPVCSPRLTSISRPRSRPTARRVFPPSTLPRSRASSFTCSYR